MKARIQAVTVKIKPFFTIVVITLALVGVAFGINRYLRNIPYSYTENVAALKAYVDEQGMYRVAAEELVDHGLIRTQKDIEHVKVYLRGRPQSSWVVKIGKDINLIFYGQESDSLYTSENIYWLAADSQIPVRLGWTNESNTSDQTIEADITAQLDLQHLPELTSDLYYAQQKWEINQLYKPTVEQGDHWLWESLPAPGSKLFEFEISMPGEGVGSLRISVWSEVESPSTPDHRLQAKINGHLLGDENWDGKGFYTLEFEIPERLLMEGTNRLELIAPGVEDALIDIINLNWFELTSPREFKAVNDQLIFTSCARSHFLNNLSSPINIFNIDNPTHVILTQENLLPRTNEPLFEFSGKPGVMYMAVGEQGYHTPYKIEPAHLEPDLRMMTEPIDYLAVGPTDLLDPLEPLITLRKSAGLHAITLPVEWIYDQFNFGFPEPAAIQNLVHYADQKWQTPMQYLLLVGDASYDPIGYITPLRMNRLPSFFVQTTGGGQTVSDIPFGLHNFNGENLAEIADVKDLNIAIGRIPAQQPEQVKTIVNKIVSYESQKSQLPVTQTIVAIADGQEENFAHDAQEFLSQFPASYTKVLYAPLADTTNVNAETIKYFNGEASMLAYFGHGSISMWGKDKILQVEDIESLSSSSPVPLVINITCLTGFFTHPKVTSLAEAMLWQPENGALAVLAPTSLTLPYDQGFLSTALAQAISSPEITTIGKALNHAQQQIPLDTTGKVEVWLTFLLFGDPAMSLPSK